MTAVDIRCARCNRLLLRGDIDLDRAEAEGLTFGWPSELTPGPAVAPEPGYVVVPACKAHRGGRWVWPPRRPGPVHVTLARKVAVADIRAALRRGIDLTV